MRCPKRRRRQIPLLITQNFGRGRTAVFATGGSWRWQMLQPVADKSHEMFYTPTAALAGERYAAPRDGIDAAARLSADESHVKLRAEVRDRTYLPAGDATVEAHILGPDGIAETVDMRPEPLEQGVYAAEWTTPKAGSYLVEIVAKHGTEEIGPRRADVPPRRRRRRKFPRRAESRIAGEAVVGNRRTVLQAG